MSEKTKVMRISRQPSPVTITIDQKQLENVKCFKYLSSMLTDDGRCTCEIKSRIGMAKAAFNKKKNLFYQEIGLKFEEETSEMLHFGAWLCMVLKLERSGQQIRNAWKVLKCGAGEGWRRSVGPIM